MQLPIENAIQYLNANLPKVQNYPIIEIVELMDGDIGFDVAQSITKGEKYFRESVEGEFDSDIDDVVEYEFDVASVLYAVKDNSDFNFYKPKFMFSSTDEAETQEKFIELAKMKLDEANLAEFNRIYSHI